MEVKQKNILEKNKDNNKINIKNVIKLKNRTKNNTLKKENKNKKRIIKCDEKFLKSKNNYKNIYLKISEFNKNGKKTIAYFIDSFYPNIDGVVMVMENYVKFMSQFYNVVVCAPRHNKFDLEFDKYFVIYADSIPLKQQGYDLGFPQFDSKFQKLISLLKIDLIHIHSPFNMGIYGLNLAKKRKIPSFITFHSQFKRDFYLALKNQTIANFLTKIILHPYKKATVTLTMNDFSKKLLKEYGLKRKVEIISNATNIKYKEFSREYEENVLTKYNITTDKFNIIFIGRLVAVKNVWFILEVLNKLNKINDKFNFIFMGDGPELQKMKKYCLKEDLSNRINFLGKVFDEDEKAIIIKNSNLLFFPSEYDTDGIVKMECACYNVPSLCIKDTGAASTIKNDQNGFLINNDIDECVNKLNFLIKNVEIVKNIGKNANLEIYKTWEDVCKDLNILYEKYLHKKIIKKNNNK